MEEMTFSKLEDFIRKLFGNQIGLKHMHLVAESIYRHRGYQCSKCKVIQQVFGEGMKPICHCIEVENEKTTISPNHIPIFMELLWDHVNELKSYSKKY